MPYWLTLIPILLIYLWWMSRRSYAQLEGAFRRGALALRSVILVFLVGALAQPILVQNSQRQHLVCVVDISKSVSAENLEAALFDIESLVQSARKDQSDTLFSLVVFGHDAKLLIVSSEDTLKWTPELRDSILYRKILPSLYKQRTQLISAGGSQDNSKLEKIQKRIADSERFRDEIAGDRTNVETAMRLALNSGSRSVRRTIYLYTDGHFNAGRWQEAWNTAEHESVSLHIVKFDRPSEPEVAATEVTVPQKVRINEGFTARIRIVGNIATRGELSVFKDGYVVERRQVKLHKGENTFDVGGLHFREKGFHFVDVTIRAESDSQLENNRSRSIVVVPGPVRVLYVDKDDSQMLYLKNALEIEGIQVDARPAAGVPRELSELLGFDAFILSNVSADHLSLQQMRMIRTYVEDFGGGFVMLGGDESFGLGGYYGTPLEEILPVRMPIQKDLNRPSLALVMVIDKSGSMEGVKIQLAKRAAVATTEVVNPRDLIGLIAFDGASRIMLELTSASDSGTIRSQIAALNAGGGTNLYPALEDAELQLQAINARRKHVIVLSDGQTQGHGYEELVQRMAADGITLSAVGIGDGADMKLMDSIARAGGGRAYFTNDFYRIPQIFTREALRASKSMLVEKLIHPTVIADDISLREIDFEELPLLLGYVATTPKAAGRTIIVSDTGDPILAKWRYGLGRTVAFTSDTKPRWAEDWLDWPDFAKFWSQLIRSVTTNSRGTRIGIEVTHRLQDEGIVVNADVRDSEGNFVDDVIVESSLVDSQGLTRNIPVRHTGPGLFQARVHKVEFGNPQQMVWTVRQGDDERTPTPYGFVYSFSPEFREMGIAEQTLRRIAERNLGQTMSVGESRFLPGRHGNLEKLHLWPYLLTAAILLVPFDILCRRMG